MLRTKLKGSYAHASHIKSYIIRDLTLQSDLKEIAALDLDSLCKVLDNAIEKKMTIDSLADVKSTIKDLINNLSLSSRKKCLIRLKQYLTSQDFNCPGKMRSTLSLFYPFKLQSETTMLNPIYHCLDAMIKTCEKQMRWLDSKDSTAAKRKHSLGFQSPITKMLFLLMLGFSSLAKTTAAKPKPSYDQCAITLLEEEMRVSHPLDQLYQYYHIHKNVAWDEVNFYYMAEEHEVTGPQKQRDEHIEHIISPDTLFIESMSDKNRGECATSTFGVSFPKQITCQGWENEELLNRLLTLSRPMRIPMNAARNLILIADQLQQSTTLEYESIYRRGKEMFKKVPQYSPGIRNVYLSKFDRLKKIILQIHKEKSSTGMLKLKKKFLTCLKQIGEECSQLASEGMLEALPDDSVVIKERNQNLIKMIQSAREENSGRKLKGERIHKYAVRAGLAHLVPDDNSCLELIEQGDHQYDLVQTAKKDGAIIVPLTLRRP